MFDTNFFFGFPVDALYETELKKVSSSLKDLFIQDQSEEYLQRIEFEGKVMLGKFMGATLQTSTLELVFLNIISLLKCLVPDYPYSQQNILLIAVPLENS